MTSVFESAAIRCRVCRNGRPIGGVTTTRGSRDANSVPEFAARRQAAGQPRPGLQRCGFQLTTTPRHTLSPVSFVPAARAAAAQLQQHVLPPRHPRWRCCIDWPALIFDAVAHRRTPHRAGLRANATCAATGGRQPTPLCCHVDPFRSPALARGRPAVIDGAYSVAVGITFLQPQNVNDNCCAAICDLRSPVDCDWKSDACTITLARPAATAALPAKPQTPASS